MCMIDGGDDMVTVLHAYGRRARREHKCNECGRAIAPGEQYLVERFVYEGHATTHKTCRHCEAVRAWLADQCGGWVYGSVAEDIDEHANEAHYGLAVKLAAVGIYRGWRRQDGRMWRVPTFPKEKAA